MLKKSLILTFSRTSYENDVSSLSYLSNIQETILTLIKLKERNLQKEDITLEIANCTYINPGVLPIIGSWGKMLQQHEIHGSLNFSKSHVNVIEYIGKSGLYTHYTGKGIASKNAIPFTGIHTIEEAQNQIDFVMQKAPVNLNTEVEDIISSKLLEIFLNSFEHGSSQYPIFSCGYWRPHHNTLTFSIYDLGVGIPYNVRQFLGPESSNYTDISCIKKAIRDGFSTAKATYPRGLGLGVLIDFVKLNKGTMTLCSGKGHYSIDNNANVHYNELNASLLGTLFTIDIKADNDHIYTLA